MLEACAPDYKVRPTTHYYCVTVGAKTYPAFPKGGHGMTNPPPFRFADVRLLPRLTPASAETSKPFAPDILLTASGLKREN